MSMFNLSFILEKAADASSLCAAIDVLVATFPDVPSIVKTRVIPNGDGAIVMIPLPMSLSEEGQARIRSTLDESLAKNGLRKKLKARS